MRLAIRKTDIDDEIRQARVELARKQPGWTEIPETRLVPRVRFLVDAKTDLVWLVLRGDVFEPGRAAVGYVNPNTPMTFFVDRAGEIVFLEQAFSGRTWSQIVEKRAKS